MPVKSHLMCWRLTIEIVDRLVESSKTKTEVVTAMKEETGHKWDIQDWHESPGYLHHANAGEI